VAEYRQSEYLAVKVHRNVSLHLYRKVLQHLTNININNTLLTASLLSAASIICSIFKPHSARTGRTVFSQLSDAVVRHKANDGVVYAIRAWFEYDTALSAVV